MSWPPTSNLRPEILPYNPLVKLRLLVIALAAAALVAPLPAALIERAYARTVFPRLQPVVTALSNLTAVAWFDLLLVVAVGGFLGLCLRDVRASGFTRALLPMALRLVTLASVAYLAFLLLWGLNYRRQPMRERLPFEPSRISPESAVRLARESVAEVNALHRSAHAQGWPAADQTEPRLVASLAQALAAVGDRHHVEPGRPKRSVLDLYFRRAGVAGMTNPFFLETLIASDLLPFERPQVVAHEWAHLAGISNEGEANFLGWLTCLRGNAAQRYSGWLFLYSEVVSGLPRAAAQEVSTALADGPRADLRAIRARYEREVNPRVSGAGWQVYDSYLKANRVDAGTASYAEVVQLILGTGVR